MKQFLLMIAVALVGCWDGGKKTAAEAKAAVEAKAAAEAKAGAWVSDPSNPNNVKIETAIREQLKKPTGELTKADLERVTKLNLGGNQLTKLPEGLEKLAKLTELWLRNNPDPTKDQIAELQKALPKCRISSNATKLSAKESAKVIEAVIRGAAKKPTGELTKADLEKVTELDLGGNQLTDVKGLEKLTQLEGLDLSYNPDLTKGQIAELQKALPKCIIEHSAKK